MFASQSKLKITLTFDSVPRFLFKNFSFDQSSVNFQFSFLFFLFKGKKVVYTSFQREIPCSRPLHVFFFSKNASTDQSSVN